MTTQGPTEADKYAEIHAHIESTKRDVVESIGRAYARGYEAGREQGRAEANAPIPLGHIKDDKGVVRRVLGTLPVTKDGVVAMPGTEVFHPDQDTQFHLEVMRCDWTWVDDEFPLPEGCEYVAHYSYYEHDTGFSARETYDVGACYSTREAALAARGNT